MASLASDDAGTPVVQAPSAVEFEFVVPDPLTWWEVIPTVDRTDYGNSVASAGDVDGDDHVDILVGAWKDETIDGKGAAYLYLGFGGGLSTTDAWTVHGGEWAVRFGSVVAGAGDVNNDGNDDIIIGDDQYRGLAWVKEEWQRTQTGRAFLYEGIDGQPPLVEPTWSYTGTVQSGEFAYAVAGAGDLNDDGYDDIVVGASRYTDSEGEDAEGAVYVFFGSESGPSPVPDWLIDGDQRLARLGAAVSGAGDVNGDGYDDLIVSADKYVNPATGAQEGAAFLFLGRETGAPAPESVDDAAWRAYGGQEESYFGTVVAGAGDVNGDGYADVVVSTPRYHRPWDDMEVGAAFAYCGSAAGLGGTPCWQVYGSQPGAQFGFSAAGAGDVNGDGLHDVIVGAPLYRHDLPDGTHPEGAAFVYFGSGGGLRTWAGWRARGDKARTDFGASVSSAGDVKGQGYDGVIIGAPQYFKYENTPYGAAFCNYGPLEPSALEPVAFLPLVMRNAD